MLQIDPASKRAPEYQLAIASPDAQVRAMATSAGVLGLATTADAQAALRRGDTAPEPSENGEPALGVEGGAVLQLQAPQLRRFLNGEVVTVARADAARGGLRTRTAPGRAY